MRSGKLTVVKSSLLAVASIFFYGIFLFCTDPLNPNDATEPSYSPTTFDLSFSDEAISAGDTLRNGLTTDKDIRLKFETERAHRIEAVHGSLTANAETGATCE